MYKVYAPNRELVYKGSDYKIALGIYKLYLKYDKPRYGAHFSYSLEENNKVLKAEYCACHKNEKRFEKLELEKNIKQKN